MLHRDSRFLIVLLGACAGGNRGSELPDFTARSDLSIAPTDATVTGPMKVVVNEIAPNGADPATDPDWVELKNLGPVPFDLTGYQGTAGGGEYRPNDTHSLNASLQKVMGNSGTPALALCACLLRATQSRSTPEEGKGG